MNILALDATQRTLLSSLVRLAIADRINYNPHDYLWRDMRRCAGIPDQRHLITQQQAWLLISIAMYWHERRSLPSQLERNRFANAALTLEDPTPIFQALPDQRIDWQETLQILREETGRNISERTVRDWGDRYHGCPKFSRKRTYTQGQVKLLLHYAKRSSAFRAA